MTTKMKLPFNNDSDWRWRWVYTTHGERLHRISTAGHYSGKFIQKSRVGAKTLCGIHGRFFMPGLFSRLELPRCNRCCNKLRIPLGAGAPFNTKTVWRNK